MSLGGGKITTKASQKKFCVALLFKDIPLKNKMTKIKFSFRLAMVTVLSSILCACTTTDVFKTEPVEPINLYLAGVSFTGNFNQRQVNYPNSYALSKNGALDKAFVDELKKHDFSYIELTTDLGESNKSSDAVAMSLGINLETVSTSHIATMGYKTVADIYSEILIFDFDSKKIITSLPVNMQYITVTPKRPTTAEITKIFSGMIFGTDESVEKSLFRLAAEKLEEAKVKQHYGARFKVDTVSINPKAKKVLNDLGVSRQQFESITAQMLTRSLVDNLHVAVVPYTKGEAIGSKMAARFANGDAFMFELPPADYAFNIKFKRFQTETDESNPALDIDGYYVFLNANFEQPDLGKRYLERNFMASSTATLVKGQKNNEGIAYLETILNFFEGLSENIADPNTRWIKDVVHPDNVKATELQLEEIHDLINNNR